jgi:hypothetical protein
MNSADCTVATAKSTFRSRHSGFWPVEYQLGNLTSIIRVLHRVGPTKTLFEARETMRLTTGGNLTSFHSGRISVSGVSHTKEHTVFVELQLGFEGKLNLLLYTAQDIGQIADKLGMIKGTYLNEKMKFPTDPRMVSTCHGCLTTCSP